MRTPEVERNEASNARIWVSGRTVSSNPGVSTKVTEVSSTMNASESATSFVIDFKLSLTSRLESLARLMNYRGFHLLVFKAF